MQGVARNKIVAHLIIGAVLLSALVLYDRHLWKRIVLYFNARSGSDRDETNP